MGTNGVIDTLPDINLLEFIVGEQERDPGLIFETLDSERQLQTLAMELRNQIFVAIKSGRPGSILSPRGAQRRHGVIDQAIKLELLMRDGGDNNVLSSLYAMKARVDDVLEPRQRARAILDRLKDGGELRKDNGQDLSDDDIVELIAAIKDYPRLRGIVEGMVSSRMRLKEQLDRDKKFPTLLSHAAFLRRIDAHEDPGVFLFADISNFKELNDTYGLSFVDEVVLRSVCNGFANIIKEKSEERLQLCRQGGDEFMLFVRRYSDQKAVAKFFAQTFQKIVRNVSSKSVLGALHLCDEKIQLQAKAGPDPRQSRDRVVQTILSSIHALECKIGADARQSSMSAQEAEAVANSRMTATKAFKNLGFPTVLGSNPSEVFNPLTGQSLPVASRASLKSGHRS